MASTFDAVQGATAPDNALLVAGTDGTNLRALLTDSTGKLNTTHPDVTQAISLTAVAQTTVLTMNGRASASFILTSVGSGGQVVCEGSIDGANWFSIDVWSEFTESWVAGGAAITTTGSWWFEPVGALNAVRIRVTALTSGTITGTMLADDIPMGTFEYQGSAGQAAPPNIVLVGSSDGTNLQAQAQSAKGVQPTTTNPYLAVQAPKDAGRTYISITADRIAGITTEALITTLTVNKAGTATAGQTSYTVTAGKTFRLTSLYVEILNTTTVVNRVLVRVRVNSGGAAVLASPVVLMNLASGAAALAAAGGNQSVSIPDGLEIPAGSGIGISQLCTVTTAGIVSVTLVGYEY